jgi:phosphoglycerate dehydrogenase-like enzyme
VLQSPTATRLKLISRWGVGYDSIDVLTATKLGIVVTYTPGLLDDAVADYTFALLLALARRVHEGHVIMRGGEWRATWGSDVSGKTLGIVGCGRIGQAVAQRAGAFKMRVLACDVSPSPAAKALAASFISLDELLAESDYVSLHAALTPQSRGLIGEGELRKMKPTAYLINAGRGALVDETALLRALQAGWIAGAALDTYATEPLPAHDPLRRAPNVLLAPHQASFARETGERVSMAAAQAVVDLMDGRPPQEVLNPEVFRSVALRTALKS